MADREVYELKLSVKVDKENAQADLAKITSSLQQMGYQVKNLENITKAQVNTAKKQKEEYSGLQKEINSLISRWLSWGAAIYSTIKFIQDSIKQATEQIRVYRELNGILNNLGLSHQYSAKQLDEYAKSLSKNTIFTKDETLKTLTQFIKLTGNVNSGLYLLKTAMDVATGSGKDLNEVYSILRIALTSTRDAGNVLAKQLGIQALAGKNAQEAIDYLAKSYEGARYKISDFEKQMKEGNEIIKEAQENIGKILLPAIAKFLNFLIEDLPRGLISSVINIKATFEKWLAIIKATFKSIIATIKMNNEDIIKAQQELENEIIQIEITRQSELTELYKKEKDKKIDIKKAEIKNVKELTEEEKKLNNEYAKFVEQISKEIINNGEKTKEEQIKLVEIEYEAKKRQLEKFKQEKINTAEAEKLLEQWKETELNKIDKEEAEKRLKIKQELRDLDLNNVKDTMLKEVGSLMSAYQTDVENYNKMLNEKKISQEEFNEWIEKRTKKLNLDLEKANVNFVAKWGEHSEQMKAISEAVYSSMQGVFQNFINEAIKGGQHLENAIKNLFNNILNAFVNMLTQMAAEYLAKKFIFELTGFSVGGGFLGVITGAFQSGGTIPKTGTYLLHKGEKIIPAGSSETITNNNPVVVNLNFHSFDVRQIDRIHMERLARTMADYLKGKV